MASKNGFAKQNPPQVIFVGERRAHARSDPFFRFHFTWPLFLYHLKWSHFPCKPLKNKEKKWLFKWQKIQNCGKNEAICTISVRFSGHLTPKIVDFWGEWGGIALPANKLSAENWWMCGKSLSRMQTSEHKVNHSTACIYAGYWVICPSHAYMRVIEWFALIMLISVVLTS